MSNCALSAAGYGNKIVTVERVSHGMSIDATVGYSRHAKALYSKAHSEAPFSLVIVFRDYAEFDGFNKWMQGYGSRLANPGSSVGPMRVIVPSRDFDRVGVPMSPIPFGDKVGDLLHRTTLAFMTTRDLTTVASSFQNNSLDNQTKYFSPAGEQLSGNQTGVGDAIYDYKIDKAVNDIKDLFRSIFG